MNFSLELVLFTSILFVGMLCAAEVGRRIGGAHTRRSGELAQGIDAVEAAVFGLLALLIAFTFSGAASRFDDRRHLIAEEANAIGTAYLRVDLLPADAQPEIRTLFRRYLDVRWDTYRHTADDVETNAMLRAGAALQSQIWTKAVSACQAPGVSAPTATLVLSSLNEMFDITDTRVAATRNHPPQVVFWLLAALCLLAALLVGYATSRNKERIWLHTIVFAAILSLTVYVILEIEYPRRGLIRVDSADQALLDLHRTMR